MSARYYTFKCKLIDDEDDDRFIMAMSDATCVQVEEEIVVSNYLCDYFF